MVDILSYDNPVLPPVVRKKQSPITSFILGKKSQTVTKKGTNHLSAVGVVEELFEEGSAMLAERYVDLNMVYVIVAVHYETFSVIMSLLYTTWFPNIFFIFLQK